mmetsp:Transcript_27865/g.83982  ORF Transcript_27865/g.83982 Transcript_27865/m.83982 type:complete len:228 (+) Transcript_27865:2915-3598(+)
MPTKPGVEALALLLRIDHAPQLRFYTVQLAGRTAWRHSSCRPPAFPCATPGSPPRRSPPGNAAARSSNCPACTPSSRRRLHNWEAPSKSAGTAARSNYGLATSWCCLGRSRCGAARSFSSRCSGWLSKGAPSSPRACPSAGRRPGPPGRRRSGGTPASRTGSNRGRASPTGRAPSSGAPTCRCGNPTFPISWSAGPASGKDTSSTAPRAVLGDRRPRTSAAKTNRPR